MIEIEAKVLARAMKVAASVVARRNTIPILANVLLRAEGDELLIVTSDLELEVAQRVKLAAPGEFAATVDAGRLSQLASAVPDGAQVSLDLADNGRVTVKSGRSRWQLPALPEQDFPRLTFEPPVERVKVPAAELFAAVGRVRSSVSTDQTRVYLTGVYFDTEDGCLRLAATDGSRGVHVTLATKHTLTPNLIVPLKVLAALQALGDEGEIAMEFADKRLRARHAGAEVTALTIDHIFPDYRGVWPADADHVLRFDPESMRKALRRVCLVCSAKTRVVKLERHADKLVLGATDHDGGTATEEMPAQCSEGFSTGFNAQLFDQMLEAIGGDTVEIHQADPAAPAKINRCPPDGAFGVLMPYRI